jgi:pSer/pThr/pTyr-binding forkhead associated (FHA) protein
VRVAGQDLLLDAPVVVGRRPAGPRVGSGPVPRLVTVPSPRHEVSGAHVDVRQQGGIVVVTDLRSTNGTRVTEPGRVPVVLRQGESLVARAGTIVDVGDGNLLEILPPQRIIPTKEPLL